VACPSEIPSYRSIRIGPCPKAAKLTFIRPRTCASPGSRGAHSTRSNTGGPGRRAASIAEDGKVEALTEQDVPAAYTATMRLRTAMHVVVRFNHDSYYCSIAAQYESTEVMPGVVPPDTSRQKTWLC